ncbi:MAG: tetratricopeptide repeat protein [bacterium]|nr:tetratricopeptide repeat protein [bacterium]
MDHFDKQPKFEIQPIIEQRPFESPAVQSFFKKWCEINDSITPQIVNRDEWEQRGMEGILEKNSDGKLTLYLPDDLQLWEMVSVMELIDRDTFAVNPERQNQKKEELFALGKLFQNSGTYIAQRIRSIHKGKEIARALAEEFYDYGQSVASGEKAEIAANIEDIAENSLTPSEIEEVDRFLAGESLYKSRQTRTEKALRQKSQPSQGFGGQAGQADMTDSAKRDKFYETERRRTLAQFFRASAKALELSNPKKESFGFRLKTFFKKKIYTTARSEQEGEQKTERNDYIAWREYQKFLGKNTLSLEEQKEKEKLERIIFVHKPWKLSDPAHSAFIARINRAIVKQVEAPKRELYGSLFRRGMELLQRNMPFDTLPAWVKDAYLHWNNGEKTLREALQIDRLKNELQTARKSGDTARISAKEREIADTIQSAIGSFPYKLNANNPAEMVANQYINCVGSSMLGGAFMKEAGLNYLVGDVPQHSILFLVTENGNVEWRDMLSATFNEKLTNEMIVGDKKDGSPLTVRDIVAFSDNPKPEGLMFDIKSVTYRNKLHWVKEGQRQYVTVFEAEYGQQRQVLSNTGSVLLSLGRNEEAIEAYRQAVTAYPKFMYPYNGMGNALVNLRRNEEAIEAYRQAIAIDPQYSYPYNGMGNALVNLSRNEEAMELYRQAIAIDPQCAHPYYNMANILSNLGRNQEAIEAYQKYIDLADTQKDDFFIKNAERMIVELSNR